MTATTTVLRPSQHKAVPDTGSKRTFFVRRREVRGASERWMLVDDGGPESRLALDHVRQRQMSPVRFGPHDARGPKLLQNCQWLRYILRPPWFVVIGILRRFGGHIGAAHGRVGPFASWRQARLACRDRPSSRHRRVRRRRLGLSRRFYRHRNFYL